MCENIADDFLEMLTRLKYLYVDLDEINFDWEQEFKHCVCVHLNYRGNIILVVLLPTNKGIIKEIIKKELKYMLEQGILRG